MDSFQQEAVRMAIDDMFNKSHCFSICDVDKIGKMVGTNPKAHPDYKFLSSIHCVHYTDMKPEFKAELPARVMQCLSSKVDSELMTKALLAVATGEIKNLPPIEDETPATLKLFNRG